MREPFKLIVWGPGGLGAICIREALRLPEFELAGVRTYGPTKVGIDAGTLVGRDPAGVLLTDNVDALLALDCDCILYTARDVGTYTTDDEIVRILEAGRSIVTALPYHNMHVARGAEFAEKIEQTCRRSGSVFHATGVDPTLIPDQVMLSLTGFTNNLRSTTLQEFWDTSNNSRQTLEVLGFGASVEAARNSPAADASAGNFLRQGLYGWAEVMGVTYDRVGFDLSFGVADRDIQLDAMIVRKGTVARTTRRLTGYVGDVPLMAVELNWMIDKSALPPAFEMAVGSHGWLISIEGSPSVRAFIEIRANLETDARYMVPGDIHSDPGYNAVVSTMLQSVPFVVRAEPGIFHAPLPLIHWRRDLRAD